MAAHDLPLDLPRFADLTIHPDDRDAYLAAMQALTPRERTDGEFRFHAGDGDPRWFKQVVVLQEQREEGKTFLLTCLDVSAERRRREDWASAREGLERKIEHRERELSQTSLQYQDLMDSSLQGLFLHDGHNLLYANAALAKFLGYRSPDHLTGMEDVWGMFPEEEQERLRGYRMRRKEGRAAPDTYECKMLCRDGRRVWAEFRVSTPSWRGEQVYLVSVIDISERREAEQAMLAARRDAELASQLKSDFLAKMSHELRTPLNAIIGFSQSLGATPPADITQEKLDEYAGYIQQGAHHLLHIVNEILDLSKIEAGRYDLIEEPTSLSDVVHRSSGLASGLATPRQVEIRVRGLEEDVRVFSDERALTQAVLNILSNAVKFSPMGGEVTVTVNKPDPDQGVEIAIADQGDGIPPEKLSYVLTPFGQLGANEAYRASGTGLGLPIAKSLIDLHEGHLTIESEPGEGTTVRIQLPAFRTML